MTVVVRRATPGDLSGVLDVFLDCWRGSYRGILPDAVIDQMTDERADALWQRVLTASDGVVLVAEREGVLIGVTRYALPDAPGGDGAVHSLYVSPRGQGGGVGRLLLDAASAALRDAGAPAVTLWVFAANTPSIGFYEAQGWRPDGGSRTQSEFGLPEQRMRGELA